MPERNTRTDRGFSMLPWLYLTNHQFDRRRLTSNSIVADPARASAQVLGSGTGVRKPSLNVGVTGFPGLSENPSIPVLKNPSLISGTESASTVAFGGTMKLIVPIVKLVLAGPVPSVNPLNVYTWPRALFSTGGLKDISPPGKGGIADAGLPLSCSCGVLKSAEMPKDDTPLASTVSTSPIWNMSPGATTRVD